MSDEDDCYDSEWVPDPVAHNAQLRNTIAHHIAELIALGRPSPEQAQAILRLKEASFWLDEDLRARIFAENQPKP